MTIYENLISKSIDELAEWIDEYGQFDDSPWINWFNENYCNKCESIKSKPEGYHKEIDFSWCELNDNKCKFFSNLDEVTDNKQIIKLWLESEMNNESY